MKIHLNLKRKWFDMILSGEKKEEYREIKYYWMNRFCYYFNQRFFKCKNIGCSINCNFVLKKYTSIVFSNGYKENRPQFEIECIGFEIKEGNANWGAEKGKKYFVLKLGKIIKKEC